ncbi:MAG TPA: NAD-dependent epimerase/dehydratase family protein [Candidatus Methylacidiphilales bacterium]|nr:NAD-dependent epimerase/dehydratase family protein [Candidatus Methylacidiphilales bacterium]
MVSQILITGATGFIGRQLTRDLVSAGQPVRILARNPEKARSLFGETIEIVAGDLCDSQSVKRACAGISTIYHIGGIYRFGIRHRREIYQTNIDGTENLLAAAAAAQVEKIVYVSSASVLTRPGCSSHPWPVLSETDFPSHPPRFSPYKYSKWAAERHALAWSSRGLPVVIASLSCPIGFGDEAPTPTGQMIDDFIRGRFPFYCRVGLNFVNVSDVSAGLQLTAQAGRVGERYLLTNQNLWLKEFLDYLASQTGLPSPRLCLPHWPVLAASCFGEMADLLGPRSQSARVCMETALQLRSVQFFSNAKARQELGWSPSPVQSGIQQALAWFRQESVPELACDTLPVTKSHVR